MISPSLSIGERGWDGSLPRKKLSELDTSDSLIPFNERSDQKEATRAKEKSAPPFDLASPIRPSQIALLVDGSRKNLLNCPSPLANAHLGSKTVKLVLELV